MPLQTLPCRAFQRGFALGARLLPWRTPTVLSGAGSLLKLPDVFSREGASRPLVVASRRQCADERFLALRAALEGRGVRPSVFSGVEPDPSVATVEKLAAQYRADGCDSFLVLGGGSPIDAAKVAAARIVRPDKTVAQLGGLLKVRRPLPLFIAVPTTAGTGSEATIAAVVTGEEHRKYAVSDLCLIPRYAVLDPTLTLSLPPAVTAQTGMDALTHAVEAYLSLYYNTRETRALAESAVRDIFRYLPVACRDGQSLTARERMLRASFDAGCAFTRASVGNVHAIAHTLGGLYGIPHGLACAVTLPVVLEDYGQPSIPTLPASAPSSASPARSGSAPSASSPRSARSTPPSASPTASTASAVRTSPAWRPGPPPRPTPSTPSPSCTIRRASAACLSGCAPEPPHASHLCRCLTKPPLTFLAKPPFLCYNDSINFSEMKERP